MDWHNDQQKLSPDEMAAIYNGGYGDPYQHQYASAPACSAEAEGPRPVFAPTSSQVDQSDRAVQTIYDKAAEAAYECGLYRLAIEYVEHKKEIAGYAEVSELKAAVEDLKRGIFNEDGIVAGVDAWLKTKASASEYERTLDLLSGM
jgi:hypothetical protein